MSDNRYLKKITGCITACILRKPLVVLLCLLCLVGCDKLFNKDEDDTSQLPAQAELTHLPCDSAAVIWMQPFGNVDHGGGNAFFHNGIDFGTQPDGPFFSSADGNVTQVELNTGKGWPGTNYRITIQVAKNVSLDYHFEIGGDAPESQRTNSIFVAVGDKVEAGQHIGNLIVVSPDVAHVHWGIYEDDEADKCPLGFFTENAAQSFEALYDSGIEKRPGYRSDLCE